MITRKQSLILVFVCCVLTCLCFDENPFDDTILFKFDWLGPFSKETLKEEDGFDSVNVTSVNNEKYQCVIPNDAAREKKENDEYAGLNAYELLQPLFSQSSCSYRLESYWTYELCHGRYIRQYHEEREGKKVKLQEFYLGRWDAAHALKLNEELAELERTHYYNIPTKKMDSVNMPYVGLNMTGGTLCDLTGTSRMTRVLYICYQHGKHEVYSLKETSSCEYEMVVLSPLLCAHPRYRPHDTGERIIRCYAHDGAPRKPKGLLTMEAENIKVKHQKSVDDAFRKAYAIVFDTQDGENNIKIELHPIDINGEPAETHASLTRPTKTVLPAGENMFLSGKACITGGTTWWKYEFCYLRTVSQFHTEDKVGTKTSILLGKFDKKSHIEWLEQHPDKKYKPQSSTKEIIHYYTNGDICEITGKPRHVEVKMKCVEDVSKTSITLFLKEPKTCEYILGVESALVCDLLSKVDEYGLHETSPTDDEGVTVTEDEESNSVTPTGS